MIKKIRQRLLKTFEAIDFVEDTHTYYLNGEQLPSVSSLLKNFYEEFDSYNIGIKYAGKMNLNPEDVWKAWGGNNKLATDKGHRVHLFGENYARWRYFGIGDKPEVNCKQTLGIVQFYNHIPEYLVPVGIELMMYSEEFGYSGTCDGLFLDTRNNTLVLYDYKTNQELFGDSKPLFHVNESFNLLQNNYGKYCLQFSYYQLLLQLQGFKVSGRVLVWLDEDKDNKKLYKTFKTPDLTQELIRLKHVWSPLFKKK